MDGLARRLVAVTLLALLTAPPASAIRVRVAAPRAAPVIGGAGVAAVPLSVRLDLASPVAASRGLAPTVVAAPAPTVPALPASRLASVDSHDARRVDVAPPAPPSAAASTPAEAAVADVIAAGLGEAEAGASPPLIASRARADVVVRSMRGEWSARTLLNDSRADAARESRSPAETYVESLRENAKTVRRAAEGVRLKRSPLRGLLTRPLLRKEAARFDAEADRVQARGLDAGEFLDKVASSLNPERKRQLEGLRYYLPTLDVSRFAAGHGMLSVFDALGNSPGGYSDRTLPDARGVVWVGSARPASFIHTAAHEAAHQSHGDANYLVADKAATKLYGAAGIDLVLALTEGYTELTAREAVRRIIADAKAGVPGFPQEYLGFFPGGSVEERVAGYENWAAQRERYHPYSPFVEMTRLIVGREGGREAFEALVHQGDVAPLIGLVGEERMELLAVIAKGGQDLGREPAQGSGRPVFVRAAEVAGLDHWLNYRLVDVMEGRLTRPSEARSAVRRAESLAGWMESEILSTPAWLQARKQRAFERNAVHAWLDRGATDEQVKATLKDAASWRRFRNWLPTMDRRLAKNLTLPAGVVPYVAVPFLYPALLEHPLVTQVVGVLTHGDIVALGVLVAAFAFAGAYLLDYARLTREWRGRLYELITRR